MPDLQTSGRNFIQKEIPALDGIRGIAILMVMAAHAGFAPEQPFLLYPAGVLGVDVFMTLSGFLIVSALLKDHELCGAIRFKKFYLRRAARILPALCSFLLACGAISLVFPTLIERDALINAGFGALTCSLNLAMVSNCTYWQPLAHLWSLSLEEQFYLILPLTLAMLLNLRSTLLWVAVAALPIVVSVLTRFQGCVMHTAADMCWNIKIAHGSASRFMGQTIGAIFGCLWRFGLVNINGAGGRLFTELAILGGVLYVLWSDLVGLRSSCGGLDFICLLTIGLIVVSLRTETTLIKKVLMNRFLGYSGKVSFGLYLWHIPAMWIVAATVPIPRLIGAAVAILITYGLATISYYCLEVPALKTVKGMLR